MPPTSTKDDDLRFLRYPGGKYKLLSFLSNYLPQETIKKGRYIEPFVGGGAVYFYLQPERGILSDLNQDLVELYKGIKNRPHKVWETFESFPSGKDSFYKIRDSEYRHKPLSYRAARTLYLNRTCFKGMWRHSSDGNFNVGYGGEERRWVITHENIMELSRVLSRTIIKQSDFEPILNNVEDGDFIFLDPPYKPGERDLCEKHYSNGKFPFEEQKRLARIIKTISREKQIRWLMTNSANDSILKLYKNFRVIKIPKGTSDVIGVYTSESNEVLISNF